MTHTNQTERFWTWVAEQVAALPPAEKLTEEEQAKRDAEWQGCR
jgi:hypothetical protein